LETVVLDEPSPFVQRFREFETDFADTLHRALHVEPDFSAAAPWRESRSWDTVARLTAEGYRLACGG